MRLIGNKPPKTWPIKVFWILVLIHLPMIALMVVTNIVQGTLLRMIEFWAVNVPVYLFSLLMDPLRLASAIIAAYLVWYAMQLDWTPFLDWLRGTVRSDDFVRGRKLLKPRDFQSKLGTRRLTLTDRSTSDRQINRN